MKSQVLIVNCKSNIDTLDKNQGMIMKKIQVDKLEDIISEIDYKISNLNKQTGHYEECITNIEGKIFEKQTELQVKKTLYTKL